MQLLEKLLIILPLLLPLIPVAIKLLSLLGQLTSNKRLHNLTNRADVIVAALEQTNISNKSKQMAAIDKLMHYAREVGIDLTDAQANDYIESSYLFLKLMIEEKKKLQPIKQSQLDALQSEVNYLSTQKGEVIDGQTEVPGKRCEFESQEVNIFDKK